MGTGDNIAYVSARRVIPVGKSRVRGIVVVDGVDDGGGVEVWRMYLKVDNGKGCGVTGC